MLTVSCVAWQLARMRTYKHVWVRSINWGDRLARKTPREAWGKALGGGGWRAREGAACASTTRHHRMTGTRSMRSATAAAAEVAAIGQATSWMLTHANRGHASPRLGAETEADA